MKITGLMRIRNEARWIERSIASILPLCDRVIVLDDGSTDGTPALCAAMPRVEMIDSPFTGTNEVRDKNRLLAMAQGADWIVAIDGDEVLAPGGVEKIRAAMESRAQSISMRIPYLWDSENQIRVDGVYGEFRRHSVFRPQPGVQFESTTAGGFHCGNVPRRLMAGAVTIDAQLLHYGYMHAEDRERKYVWYNSINAANDIEDRYRHVAAGLDSPHERLIAAQKRYRLNAGLPELRAFEILPPAPLATDRTAHAGPLRLEPLR